MPAPDYDVAMLGAASPVGQVLTHYSAEHSSGNVGTLRQVITGRSEAKFLKVKRSLDAAGESVPIIMADAASEAQLQALCAQMQVVVSMADPYILYGEPLVKVCAENGTDYCNLIGGIQWIECMIDTCEATARRSKTRTVHCCDFDSAPLDTRVYPLQ